MSRDHVTTLELWDAEVDGHPLQAWRHHPSFPERLAAVVHPLATSPGPRPAIASVVLAGGGASPSQVTALRRVGLFARIVGDPVMAAARAGLRHGPTPVDLCADLGQTSIKLHNGRRSWRIDRDPARAPFRDAVSPSRWSDAREHTLRFIAEALRLTPAPRRLRPCAPACHRSAR